MHRVALASMLVLILTLAPRAAGADGTPVWADHTNAHTKETCEAALRRPLPPADSAGTPPARCDLVALYDGIGGKPDYKSALACALHKKATDNNGPFDSYAILAMLYANGYGMARNDDLAIAYACRTGWAPAEMDGRIAHLSKRKTEGAAAKPFDFCDDITSGFMQGWCTGRDERTQEFARDAKLAALTQPLGRPARTAYERLMKAHDIYLRAVWDNEVDVSGTGRGMFLIAAKATEKNNFVAALEKTLPPARVEGAPEGYAKADARLNARYKRLQAIEEKNLGTVTHAGIKTTERAWLAYRDAFLAFAAKAAPNAPRDAVATLLTEQRIARLGDVLGDDER